MNQINPLRSMFNSIVRGTQEAAPVAAKPETETTLDATGKDDGANKGENKDDAADEGAGGGDGANKGNEGDDGKGDDKAPVLDGAQVVGVLDAVGDYASTDIDLKVAAAIQQWAETDDLGDGEGYGDRLFALLVGIADADMDGEIGEEEADIVEMAADSAWDYLAGKDVPDDDLEALLNDWDNDVAARVHELIVSKLPDGDEASAADIDAFAFGDGSDEAALDATYKKKLVVRKGKKMRVMKRVSGVIRLSAKQKLAVRKMIRKSHGAKATMRRAKSMRVRRQMGM